MSQAKTRNCWKQFPHVSTVARLHLLYSLKPAHPSPPPSPWAHRGSTSLAFPAKETKAENTGEGEVLPALWFQRELTGRGEVFVLGTSPFIS